MLLASCARHEVMTNTFLAAPSLQEAAIPDAAFAVIPNTNVANPILDQTVKEKIEFMLESMGYQIAVPGQADYFLQYHYDMEAETAVRHRFLPRRRSFYDRGSRFNDPFRDSGFGYSTYTSEPYTLYLAKLRITASSKDAVTGEQKVIWVGETLTKSLNPDLRNLIDYLIAASFRYFMKDTGRNKNVVLDEGNSAVEGLRLISNPGSGQANASSYPAPSPGT